MEISFGTGAGPCLADYSTEARNTIREITDGCVLKHVSYKLPYPVLNRNATWRRQVGACQ